LSTSFRMSSMSFFPFRGYPLMVLLALPYADPCM
jgi:hypothetical protein